jgi:hypothetical protein
VTALTAILIAGLAMHAVVAPQSRVGGQREPDPPFALAIDVTRVRTDGSHGGRAGDHGVESFESYVWSQAGLCTLAASNDEPASTPFVGWHFRGRILQPVDDDGYLVEIDWQRKWDASRPAGERSGFLQVVMRPGDRLPLDLLTAASAAPCGVKDLRLEASIVPNPRGSRRSVLMLNVPVPLSPGGGGGGRGSIRGGSGSTVGAGRGGGGGGTGNDQPVDPSQRYEAELWIVQTLADGTERAQKQTLSFGGGGRDFAFPPIRVTVGQDPIDVTVAGLLRVISSATSGERLLVMISRQLTAADGAGLGSGGASKTLAIPPAGEVVSFELPAQLSTRVTLRDQTISVRLRLK